MQIKDILGKGGYRCQSHDICQIISEILDDLHLDDAVIMGKEIQMILRLFLQGL